MSNNKLRNVERIIRGQKTADGDGVQLTRLIGGPEMNMHDPFLLMDAFGSDKPLDYIGGFPPHPHRGFETVTYMLDGKMRHKDNAGHEGVIESGGVQWMTAGRGIVHSEMPEQASGMLSGLQLWINLPQDKKMTAPAYREHDGQEIPIDQLNHQDRIKVVAGQTDNGVLGVVSDEAISPTFWDVNLNHSSLTQSLNAEHNAMVYVISGKIEVGDDKSVVNAAELAILSSGDQLHVQAKGEARFVVMAGKPLNEPVARGGPFVMNTKAEIQQAFRDYQAGKMGTM